MLIRVELFAMEVIQEINLLTPSTFQVTIGADILTGVNDVNIESVPRNQIARLLMGPFESIVELRFSRPVDRCPQSPYPSQTCSVR